MAVTLLKWGTKLGVVGGAFYITAREGIWDSSSDGSKALTRVRTSVLPAANGYFEKIPTMTDTGKTMGQYWNTGVEKTFKTLEKSPESIKEYSVKGLNYVKQNLKP